MNKIFYLVSLLLIVFLLWSFFDLSKYLPPDLIFHSGIKLESKEDQDRLAQEFINKKIPHRTRPDGFIEYRKKDNETVQLIVRQINSSFHINPILEQPQPNIHLGNSEEQNNLITLLKNEGIPYKIIKRHEDGEDYVVWDNINDERVLALLSQVLKNTNCKNSPPSISFPTAKQTDYFIDLLKKEGIFQKMTKKSAQKGTDIYIEYEWKDYVKVQKLIKKTVAEVPAD